MVVIEVGSISVAHGKDDSLPEFGFIVATSGEELKRKHIPLYTDIAVVRKTDAEKFLKGMIELKAAIERANKEGIAIAEIKSAYNQIKEMDFTKEMCYEL